MVEGSANAAGEIPARGVSVGAPARQLTAGRTRRVRLARWTWPAALAVAAVVLFLCYLRLSRTIPNGSDGADQALQAWDMLHGNWLLRGWTVGDVSYYTTELPEYMVVELIRGLGPDVIHVAAAVTYTLLVLLAGLLAKGRATGREGVIRALIASGILLAPQLGHGIALLIQQPDHIGTQVPLLVIFIVLDRAPRRWYTPAAIGVMLTWVIIADRVAVFDAALPLAAVCGIRAFWALVHGRKPLASLWFEISLMAAGIVSFGVAALAVKAINHLGGYTPLPLPPTTFAPAAAMPAPPCADHGGHPHPVRGQFRRPVVGGGGGHRPGASGWPDPGAVGRLPRVPALLLRQRPDRPGAGHRDRDQPGRLHIQHRPRHVV